VGRAGTGYTARTARQLWEKLHPLEIDKAPFFYGGRPSGYVARNLARWVRPELVAEVEFRARTTDGLLRHASFKGPGGQGGRGGSGRGAARRSAEQPNTPAVPSRAAPVRRPAAARASRITAGWAEQKAVREIMIFLHAHSVGTARAVRIFKTGGLTPSCVATG
jgi:hypothetical protein